MRLKIKFTGSVPHAIYLSSTFEEPVEYLINFSSEVFFVLSFSNKFFPYQQHDFINTEEAK